MTRTPSFDEKAFSSPAEANRALSRRDLFHKGAIGAAGSMAALLGAGASRAIAAPASVTGAVGLGPGGAILPPGTLPNPKLPVGVDTIPQIEHIVILMMENHSFDDHFGMLGRGDGLTVGPGGKPVNWVPDPAGGVVQSFHNLSTNLNNSGVGQAWDTSHTCWNGGRMDGWVKGCGPYSMGYWDETDLPFYYSLARKFPISDRYFCSVMAQTYPNRRFLIAGTAAGNVATDLTGITPDPAGGTIFELLDAHGITWKDYYPDLPTAALFTGGLGRALAHGNLVHDANAFLSDAAAGTLPQVCVVDPWDTYSEESGDISVGEAYAARVIQAVMESPLWPKTVLFFTYDEHGGWYDHVPPPPTVLPDAIPPRIKDPGDIFGDYNYLGFRVPFVAVSAWARANYVSHVVASHTSILRFIERKWNLPALTYRDANSTDLMDLFDFRAKTPPFTDPPKLASPKNPLVGPLPGSSYTTPTSAYHPLPAFDDKTLPVALYHRDAPVPGASSLLAAHAARFPSTNWSASALAAAGGQVPSPAIPGPSATSDAPLIAGVSGALGAVSVLAAATAIVIMRRRGRSGSSQTDDVEASGSLGQPDSPGAEKLSGAKSSSGAEEVLGKQDRTVSD